MEMLYIQNEESTLPVYKFLKRAWNDIITNALNSEGEWMLYLCVEFSSAVITMEFREIIY